MLFSFLFPNQHSWKNSCSKSDFLTFFSIFPVLISVLRPDLKKPNIYFFSLFFPETLTKKKKTKKKNAAWTKHGLRRKNF